MPKITTQEVEFTTEGTPVEVPREVDIKDPIVPVRLRIHEWLREKIAT
jgi:hypothetical protein